MLGGTVLPNALSSLRFVRELLGDPRCCPESCTSGDKTFQALVSTRPRSVSRGLCRRFAGLVLSAGDGGHTLALYGWSGK